MLVSLPSEIPDRTEYLLNGGADPMPGIYRCIETLVSSGATAISIACNTAHSKKIIGRLPELGSRVKLINMIEETCSFLSEKYSGKTKIGLLATTGTVKTGVYDEYIKDFPQLSLIKPYEELQKKIHSAIYHKTMGIKANSGSTSYSSEILTEAAKYLEKEKCSSIILGCTELPIAFSKDMTSLNLTDPTEIVAIALIRATAPEKLKI